MNPGLPLHKRQLGAKVFIRESWSFPCLSGAEQKKLIRPLSLFNY
jgi:hypothetical protein